MMGKWHLGYAPENGPTRHGFDEFVGHLHGATDYVSHVDKYGRMDWWHNENPVAEKGYNTTLITRYSVSFIEKHRAQPFFLLVSHSAIHFPWMTPDDSAHRIASNVPWRGQKHGLYEGGHRVPAIARWPGKIEAGRVSDQLSITADLVSTCLELAGLKPKAASETDGISLVTHLLKGGGLAERTLYWRQGISRAVRWKDWKVVRIQERPFELYNLRHDSGEKKNLATENSEMMNELLRRLRLWEAEVDGGQ
jgi:arylsulfatase A-like enzyme